MGCSLGTRNKRSCATDFFNDMDNDDDRIQWLKDRFEEKPVYTSSYTCSPTNCDTDCAADCATDCPATGQQCLDWHSANIETSPLYADYCSLVYFMNMFSPSELQTAIANMDAAGTLPADWKHFFLSVDFTGTAPAAVLEYHPDSVVESYMSGTCASNNCPSLADATTCGALEGDHLATLTSGLCTIESLILNYSPDALAQGILADYQDSATVFPSAWESFTLSVIVDASVTLVTISVSGEGVASDSGSTDSGTTEGFCMGRQAPHMLPMINFLHIFVVFPFIYYMGTLLKQSHPQVAQVAMTVAIIGILYHFMLAMEKMKKM